MSIFAKVMECLEKLVNYPLTVDTFRQHSRKSYHEHSVSDLLTLMRIMNNEQAPIDYQLVFAIAQQVQKNKELLKSIINTVFFCGKQNVALDDTKHLEIMVTFMLYLTLELNLETKFYKMIWPQPPVMQDTCKYTSVNIA